MKPARWTVALFFMGVLAPPFQPSAVRAARAPAAGIAILQVDTDHPMGPIDRGVYGQFLEHINHSVVDGLYAEQIRGAGFEGPDFRYWTTVGSPGAVGIADVPFERGARACGSPPPATRPPASARRVSTSNPGSNTTARSRIRIASGAPRLALRVFAEDGSLLAVRPLAIDRSDWREVPYAFSIPRTERNATVEVSATGQGEALVDFVSLMRADARRTGMLRPDLLEALRGLAPAFIRWPGGSFASTYKWQDGIGPLVARVYHPNDVWGGYSDYYGFGTDEYMALTQQLGTRPLIVLPAPDEQEASIDYAMNWVHYLNDPVTTRWGRMRAANGHAAPYDVRSFQIDNEPMNNGLTANGTPRS